MDKGVQVLGIDIWNTGSNSVANYAQGGSRNITYPLAMNGSSVGIAYGNLDRSSYAIIDADGIIQYLSDQRISTSIRYSSTRSEMIAKLDELLAVTGVDSKSSPVPADFLLQNTPNPFSTTTTIQFDLKNSLSRAQVSIYDVLGRRIRTFTSGDQNSGRHSVTWDGRNAAGNLVPTGVYFYVLEGNGQRVAKKMFFMPNR